MGRRINAANMAIWALRSPCSKIKSSTWRENAIAIFLYMSFCFSLNGNKTLCTVFSGNDNFTCDFVLRNNNGFETKRSSRNDSIPGEPDHQDIYRGLKDRKYTDQDVIGFYTVRQIPQRVRERENKNDLFKRKIPPYLKHYCKVFGSKNVLRRMQP